LPATRIDVRGKNSRQPVKRARARSPGAAAKFAADELSACALKATMSEDEAWRMALEE
jgi:hypothetical protein